MGKIICIGFHKTGTTSLGRALNDLGYSVIGARPTTAPLCMSGRIDEVLSLVDAYDACEDNPWPVLYRELDARFPGSRFILSVRPPEKWLASMLNHFRSKPSRMREWIYTQAAVKHNEALYVARMQRHNREVREYFEDRPADLLELRLTEGEGWEKLCPFLGHPIPAHAFPHLNHRQRDSPS